MVRLEEKKLVEDAQESSTTVETNSSLDFPVGEKCAAAISNNTALPSMPYHLVDNDSRSDDSPQPFLGVMMQDALVMSHHGGGEDHTNSDHERHHSVYMGGGVFGHDDDDESESDFFLSRIEENDFSPDDSSSDYTTIEHSIPPNSCPVSSSSSKLQQEDDHDDKKAQQSAAAALEVLQALAGLVADPLSQLLQKEISHVQQQQQHALSATKTACLRSAVDDCSASCRNDVMPHKQDMMMETGGSPQSVMDIKRVHKLRAVDVHNEQHDDDAHKADSSKISRSMIDDHSPILPSLSSSSSSSSAAVLSPRTSESSSPRQRARPIFRKPSLKRISSYNGCASETSSRNSSDEKTPLKRTISFGRLELREYSICLSDHPACSYGPPISLGWDFVEHDAVPFEDYEVQRQSERCEARDEMILSYHDRKFLLLKRAGYSKRELRAAMEEVDRVKLQRMVTDFFLPFNAIDETIEHAVHHIKGIFSPFSSGQGTTNTPQC